MGNSYVEVSRTYIRRLFSSWMVVLCTVVTLAMIAMSLIPRHARTLPGSPSISIFIGMAVLFMALVLWAHFHEQVASDRRTIWPNYVRPHVVVFTTVAIAFAVGWPIAVNLLHDVGSVGLLALTTSIFALVGWYAATAWAPILVLAIAMQLAMMLPTAAEIVLGEKYEQLQGGVVVVALVASVSAAFRMLRMRENDAGYGAAIRFDTWSLRPRMTGDVNRAWSQQRGLFWRQRRVYIPTGNGIWECAPAGGGR